jgi:hypothetical protein
MYLALFEAIGVWNFWKRVGKTYTVSVKNITDFLLNTFLQVYFFMYGRQVIQDLNMLLHIQKAQEMQQESVCILDTTTKSL